jgi:hypothetical protein
MLKILLIPVFLMIPALSIFPQDTPHPQGYVAYQVANKPVIDGLLDDAQWMAANWSEAFQDIRGGDFPAPDQLTQMKMLWDKDFLYIGVKLNEDHIWATYTEREAIIFQENDIEIFIDPDGDTHNYYEIEINALGTLWDLLMTKPYKNGGRPINGWNINDFEYAIHLDGTINDPLDTDYFWSIEMAIPWKSLSQSGPNFKPPLDGEQWRINFSRVQWQIEPAAKGYAKMINPETGKRFPEDNWVWSPVGVVNMHLPERWGYVQFSHIPVGKDVTSFIYRADEKIKVELRKLYDAQKKHFSVNGHYANQLSELTSDTTLSLVDIESSKSRFKISSPATAPEMSWYITEDGRIWKE